MTRRSYVQLPDGSLVPKEDYSPTPRVHVMGDIDPYKSMATGEMIQGRRQHREHLRQHQLIELGNEPIRKQPPRQVGGIKEDLHRAWR